MKKLLAACAGLALIGSVGATQLDAQRVTIRKSDKSVTIDNNRGNRSTRTQGRNHGHYQIVKKKVWVPGHYDTVTKKVWVPGRHITVRERRVDRYGCVFYVNVRKFVPGHYETCTERVFHPGHYEVVTEKVWVPAKCGKSGHHHGKRGHGRDAGNRGRGNARGRKGKNRGRGSRGRGR